MNPLRLFLIVAATGLLLTACAPIPRRPPPEINWVASPNFDERRPNLVIIHHTSDDTVDEALRTLTSPERKVSSHYLISRNGEILQLVD